MQVKPLVYMIMGDTDVYRNVLVKTCGPSRKKAFEILNRMKLEPTENDKKLIEGHHNLRIEAGECKWWCEDCQCQ